MSSAPVLEELTTRGRLVQSALEIVDAGHELTVEATAQAAGVSRATAYRTFSNIRDLANQVLLQRAEHHRQAILELTKGEDHPLTKIEMALVYSATVVRHDEALTKLITTSGIANEEPLHALALSVVEPVIRVGQAAGHIRSDVTAREISDWLLDAFIGGMLHRQLEDDETRRLFRTFVAPGLAVPLTPIRSSKPELERCLEHALAIVRSEGGSRSTASDQLGDEA